MGTQKLKIEEFCDIIQVIFLPEFLLVIVLFFILLVGISWWMGLYSIFIFLLNSHIPLKITSLLS